MSSAHTMTMGKHKKCEFAEQQHMGIGRQHGRQQHSGHFFLGGASAMMILQTEHRVTTMSSTIKNKNENMYLIKKMCTLCTL